MNKPRFNRADMLEVFDRDAHKKVSFTPLPTFTGSHAGGRVSSPRRFTRVSDLLEHKIIRSHIDR